jgi:hypothetical protein
MTSRSVGLLPSALTGAAHPPVVRSQVGVRVRERMSLFALRSWLGRPRNVSLTGRLATVASRTFDAVAVRSPHPRVLGRVFVAVAAMGFGGIRGGQGASAQDVHGAGDRLQMARIHASPVAAKVIQVEAFGDRANQPLVNNAMSRQSTALTDEGAPVSLRTPITQPRPALIRPVRIVRESPRINGLFLHPSILPISTLQHKGKE